MTDFLDGGGVFLGGVPPNPSVPSTDLDLGEKIYENYTGEAYWGRSLGIVYPLSETDKVAIGGFGTVYDERLSVTGKIYSSVGFILSSNISITKDGSNNLVFSDPVSGSKTLAQLIAAGSGNVLVSGTPTNGQLARWLSANTIEGMDSSSLTLAQSQITGLVAALAGKASTIHNLVDMTNHPVSGLTTGHFLKALSATTYGFTAHGLTKSDIGLSNVTNNAQVKKISSATNNAIVRWDGTSGDQIKNSVSTLGDDGSINIPTGATYNINGSPHAHAGQYQALDDTLDGLAGLDTSLGFIYQTGTDIFTKYGFAGSGSANTVSRSDHNHSGVYLTGNQLITLSGDASGSGNQAITVTFATVNANVFGTNTVLKFAVTGKGLITSAAAVTETDLQTIFGSKTANYVYAAPNGSAGNPSFRVLVAADIPTIAQSQVTNLVSDLSGKQTAYTTLTTFGSLANSTGYLFNNGSGTLSWSTPGGGGNVSTYGTPSLNQLAQWTDSTHIQGIAQSSLATDGFGSLSDITTNDATVSAHGFLPKLGGGTTNFLRADGTWAAPGSTAPTDGIWDWDGAKYAPYSSKQTTLQHFYTGTSNPDYTTRLNLDAYLYATQLYDNGTRVLTANQTITLSSDVTGSGTTSITTTIASNAVTYAKFQQVAALSVVGNATGSTANASAITGTASQILQVNSGGTALAFISIANAFGSQTANYFWAAPDGSAGNPSFRAIVKADISGTTAVFTDQANTFGDYNNTFRSSRLLIRNPANTFGYTIVAAAIAADRSITLPLLTGNDTLVTAAFIQTLTNKTINATDNTINDTSSATGDILKHNGTKYVRFAKGSGSQLLRVNSGATDIEYWTPTYISGNQTITLTGDVTGSGTTSIKTTYNNAVPVAKGGTGQTSLGSANQVLGVVNAGGASEWKSFVADSTKITITLTTANQIRFDVAQANVDHNSLLNYTANRHIDHTAVSISTQYSLTGGGDISSTRTLNLVNDVASPGNSMLYGTNGSGTRGWYAQPTGGVTPTDNILDWDAGNSWYAPYAAAGAGHFDSSSSDPTGTTRVNYGGYLHATRFYGDVYRLSGNIQHLTIKGGDASGTGNDAGHLYLKAGDPITSDSASITGSIYLRPGNYNGVTGTGGSIFLGDSSYNYASVSLTALGSSTDVAVVLTSQGNGQVILSAGSGQISLFTTGTIYMGLTYPLQYSSDTSTLYFSGNTDTLITGANANVSHVAYSFRIKGGTGYGSGSYQNGGNLYLVGGTPSGSGIYGNVILADSGGKVGIGTSSPVDKLDVVGNIAAESVVQTAFGNGTRIHFKRVSDSWIASGIEQLYDSTVGGYAGQLAFYVNTGASVSSVYEAMRIDGAKRVGIGLTVPTSLLCVSGDITVVEGNKIGIRYTSGDPGPYHYIDKSGVILRFQSTATSTGSSRIFGFYGNGGADLLAIMQSGNVAIGSSNNLTRLQVAKDSVYTDYYGQLLLHGLTSDQKRLAIGFDTTNDVGFLQAYVNSVGVKYLCLNPNGGYIGIGTISPAFKLDIDFATSGTPTASMFCLRNSTGTNAPTAKFYIESAAGNVMQLIGNSGGGGDKELMAWNLYLGRVGIGTYSPAYTLDVNGVVSSTGLYMATGSTRTIKILDAAASVNGDNLIVTAGAATTSSYNGGYLLLIGGNGNSGTSGSVYIHGGTNGTVGNVNLCYNPSVTSYGYCGIRAAANSSYGLYVSGAIYATGNITGNSDIRYKKGIADMDNPWIRGYKNIRVIKFQYKDEEDQSFNIGYSAQNLLEYFPECVSYTKDIDRYGIKQLNMEAVNTLAIQCVKSEVDILRERVYLLEQEIERLKKRA